MLKANSVANQTWSEVILAFFKVAYFIGKDIQSFFKFLKLCKLLVGLKACIVKDLFHDDKSCVDLLLYTSSVIPKKSD